MRRIAALARQFDGSWRVLLGEARRRAMPSLSHTSFYAPDFALQNPHPWLVSDDGAEWSSDQLRDVVANEPFEFSLTDEPLESDFFARHQAAIEKIADRQFKKVVPAVSAKAQVKNIWPNAIRNLISVGSELHPYGFEAEGEGMLGATPEILFAKEGLHLKTQAVAGTASHDGPSLLDDRKERLEHNLVVEDLFAQFSKLGRIHVHPTVERRAGGLKHLVTDIEVELIRDIPFEAIAQKLHPTAALGGYPRAEAFQWLQEQPEYLLRKRFGAPFGWREPNGDGVCLVAIRNIQWENSAAKIFSGCGVVKGSEAEKEWHELRLKRTAIQKVLSGATT